MLLTLKHAMLPKVNLEACNAADNNLETWNAVKRVMLFTLKHCNAADIQM